MGPRELIEEGSFRAMAALMHSPPLKESSPWRSWGDAEWWNCNLWAKLQTAWRRGRSLFGTCRTGSTRKLQMCLWEIGAWPEATLCSLVRMKWHVPVASSRG